MRPGRSVPIRRRYWPRASTLALVIVLTTATCTSAETAPPFATGAFGVNGAERGITGSYAAARQAGFEWVRIFLPWNDIQPAEGPLLFDEQTIGAKCGTFDWPRASARELVDGASDAGFSIVAVLFKTPCWAAATSGGGSCEGRPPRQEAWAAFAGAMAQEFGDKVAVWEIWNEPNYTGHWNGTPALYRDRILAPAYDAIKAARPDAKIAAPALYNHQGGPNTPERRDDPGPFLLSGGELVRPIDVLSFHAYGNKKATFRRSIKKANRFAKKHDIPETWMTEFGWSLPVSKGTCPTCGGCARCGKEKRCGKRIFRVFDFVANDKAARFTKAFNFSLHDRNRANCIKGCGYGLFQASGEPRRRLEVLLE